MEMMPSLGAFFSILGVRRFQGDAFLYSRESSGLMENI